VEGCRGEQEAGYSGADHREAAGSRGSLGPACSWSAAACRAWRDGGGESVKSTPHREPARLGPRGPCFFAAINIDMENSSSAGARPHALPEPSVAARIFMALSTDKGARG